MNKKLIAVFLIGVFIFEGCNMRNPSTTNNQTPETVEFLDKIIVGTESAFYEISVTLASTTSIKLPINFNAQKNFVRFEGFLVSKARVLFVVKLSVLEYLYIANLDGNNTKNLTEGLGC